MMILSVLLLAVCLERAQSRTDDISNEIHVNAEGNLDRFVPNEWVKISQRPEHIVTKRVGDRVELHCEAMGSPPPTLQWFKHNKRITENENFNANEISPSLGLAKVSSKLIINYVLPRHQDIYKCVAESGSNIASAASKVIVSNKEGNEMNLTQLISLKILGAHHEPKVTFWAKTYMDDMGNDVVLPCKSVGNPKPSLEWTDPQGESIKNYNNERFQILPDGGLRIRSIEWDDMGVYTCIIRNSVGEDTVETFLYPMQVSSK